MKRLEGYLGQFSVQAQKIKKNNKKKTTLKKFNTYFFKKKILIFWERELSSATLKKFLVEEIKVFPLFQEMELLAPRLKKFRRELSKLEK